MNTMTKATVRENDPAINTNYGSAALYVADIVGAERHKALSRKKTLSTPAEWVDAVVSSGLKFWLTFDIYTGTPLNFTVMPGRLGYGPAGWAGLQSQINEIGNDAILAEVHRRKVGDPLLDLVERHQHYCKHPIDLGPSYDGYAILHAEQLKAPPATTMAGVLAGLRWGIAEVDGFDQCADGVLRAALEGLLQLVGEAKADPLATLIAEYEAGDKAYGNDPKSGEGDDVYDADLVARTYGPPYMELQLRTPSATTLEGVRAALKLCADLNQGEEVTIPVARAALAFFDAGAKR